MISKNLAELNKNIREAIVPILAEFDKLAPGRVKIIEITTTADELNPPGTHYHIKIEVETIQENSPKS